MNYKNKTYDEAELTDHFDGKTEDDFRLVEEVDRDRWLFVQSFDYAKVAVKDGKRYIGGGFEDLPVVDLWCEVKTFNFTKRLEGLDGNLTVVTIYDSDNEVVERTVARLYGYPKSNFHLGLKQAEKRLRANGAE